MNDNTFAFTLAQDTTLCGTGQRILIANHFDDAEIMRELAANTAATADTLNTLSTHDAPEVRAAVAAHANIPALAAGRLLHDTHTGVKITLLKNDHAEIDDAPFVPESTLVAEAVEIRAGLLGIKARREQEVF